MGRELLEHEPVFREAIERCDELLRPLAGWSLLEEMDRRSEADSRLDQTEVAQPALFALQVGLVALWRSWGIGPARSSATASARSRRPTRLASSASKSAIRLVYHRGRLMQQATGNGRMVAVELHPTNAAA